MELMDSKVHKGCQVLMEHKASKDLKAFKVNKDQWDHKDQQVMAQQALTAL